MRRQAHRPRRVQERVLAVAVRDRALDEVVRRGTRGCEHAHDAAQSKLPIRIFRNRLNRLEPETGAAGQEPAQTENRTAPREFKTGKPVRKMLPMSALCMPAEFATRTHMHSYDVNVLG